MSFKPKGNIDTSMYVHNKKSDIKYDDEVVVCIDMDIVGYKAAAAGESRFILASCGGEVSSIKFKNRTEFHGRDKKKSGGWLAEYNTERAAQGKGAISAEDFTIIDDRDVDSLSSICHTVDVMVGRILDSCKTSNYKAYMGQGQNFRNNVATVQKYKEGRSEQLKPLYLKDIRGYIHKRFNATLIEESKELINLEADDHLSIEAYKGYVDYKETGKCTSIQASLDKDQKQCQGMFFNWDKMSKPFLVDGYGKLYIDSTGKVTGFGQVWLLLQMTAGDRIDTYIPSKLSGETFADKGAYNLLHETKTLKEGLEKVVELYKSWYPEPVTYNHCTTGEEITKDWLGLANEYFTLAYMKTSLDDDFTFTKWLDEVGVIYA